MSIALAHDRTLRAHTRPKPLSAFTLIELLVVSAIIGVLIALAVPQALRARENTATALFMSDLKVAKSAFVLYNNEKGSYPVDRTPAVLPPEIAPYLDKSFKWTGTTPIGGKWDWDYKVFGIVAGVSVYQPTASSAQLTRIDQALDNGNLSTGDFRTRSSGYISVIE